MAVAFVAEGRWRLSVRIGSLVRAKSAGVMPVAGICWPREGDAIPDVEDTARPSLAVSACVDPLPSACRWEFETRFSPVRADCAERAAKESDILCMVVAMFWAWDWLSRSKRSRSHVCVSASIATWSQSTVNISGVIDVWSPCPTESLDVPGAGCEALEEGAAKGCRVRPDRIVSSSSGKGKPSRHCNISDMDSPSNEELPSSRRAGPVEAESPEGLVTRLLLSTWEAPVSSSALRFLTWGHLAPVGDTCLTLHAEHKYVLAFPVFAEWLRGSGAMLRTMGWLERLQNTQELQ